MTTPRRRFHSATCWASPQLLLADRLKAGQAERRTQRIESVVEGSLSTLRFLGDSWPSMPRLVHRAGELANLLVWVVKKVGDGPAEVFHVYPTDLFYQGIQRIEAGLGIVVPT